LLAELSNTVVLSEAKELAFKILRFARMTAVKRIVDEMLDKRRRTPR